MCVRVGFVVCCVVVFVRCYGDCVVLCCVSVVCCVFGLVGVLLFCVFVLVWFVCCCVVVC